MIIENETNDSPFHQGELAIQKRVGKQQDIASYASKFIRNFMPEQHREFYQQLPFAVLGSVDNEGFPWASILPGKPGFIGSPTATTLTLPKTALPGDPLNESLAKKGSAIGMLGIELSTRRRNRVNMRTSQILNDTVSLKVDQSFGNCPQYIQTREIIFHRSPLDVANNPPAKSFSDFDSKAQQLIETADTFFVSSFIHSSDRPEIEGVDVSHRGGMPGFVKQQGKVLTIPDYSGNNHFNTLGNFLENPKAGLIFPDFNSGDLLMLTGTVEILWEDHPEVLAFEGAQRAWRFILTKGLWLPKALPFSTSFGEYSPSSQLTDTWNKASSRQKALLEKSQWQPMKIEQIVEESRDIKSFYLSHAQGKPLLPFKAGQHLTIKVPVTDDNKPLVRNYTLSSAPDDALYRITIKKETLGNASRYFHEQVNEGDLLQIKYPTGTFYIDANEKRPAVLLAAGVGITPMSSMVKHILNEGIKTRYTRPMTLFHVNKTWEQTPFIKEFQSLVKQSQGSFRYFPFTSQDEAYKQDVGLPDPSGRMTLAHIKPYLAFEDYDFYLCGPQSFMQNLYEQLIDFGVRDKRIYAEAFGPASIKRVVTDDAKTQGRQAEEAKSTAVEFKKSNLSIQWKEKDPTLLEVAEQQGLTPEFGCRNGSCGSCAVKIQSGSVAYRKTPTASTEDNEALICCAVPAKGTKQLVIEL